MVIDVVFKFGPVR